MQLCISYISIYTPDILLSYNEVLLINYAYQTINIQIRGKVVLPSPNLIMRIPWHGLAVKITITVGMPLCVEITLIPGEPL